MENTGASSVAEKPRERPFLLNELLTLWIFLAMLMGVGVGCLFPGIAGVLNQFQVGTTGLFTWLKTRYDKYSSITNAVGTSAARNIYEMRWSLLPKLGVIGHFVHCNKIAIFNLRSLTVTAQL